MTSKRWIIAATLLNLLLVAAGQAGLRRVAAAGPEGVLRARGLEIVDAQGRIRASITVEPATTVDGRDYPETVLLRLTDPKRGPVVKLSAASDGSALGLSDDTTGGIRAYAKGSRSYVEVKRNDGQVRIIEP
jgi:hypothetical protein